MTIRNVYYLTRTIDCLIKACSRNIAEYKHSDLSIRNYFVKYEEKVMIFWFLYLIMFLAKTLGSLKYFDLGNLACSRGQLAVDMGPNLGPEVMVSEGTQRTLDLEP